MKKMTTEELLKLRDIIAANGEAILNSPTLGLFQYWSEEVDEDGFEVEFKYLSSTNLIPLRYKDGTLVSLRSLTVIDISSILRELRRDSDPSYRLRHLHVCIEQFVKWIKKLLNFEYAFDKNGMTKKQFDLLIELKEKSIIEILV